MEHLEFAQAAARIRVLEKNLLDKSSYEQLTGLDSESEWIRWLQDRSYSPLITASDQEPDLENKLTQILESEYQTLRDMSPEPKVTALLGLKYDYHNLKVLIKSKAVSNDPSQLCMMAGTMAYERMKRDFEAGAFGDWPELLRTAAVEAVRLFERNRDPVEVDWLIHRCWLSHLRAEAEAYNSGLIGEWLTATIDLFQLTALFSAQARGDQETVLDDIALSGGRLDKSWLRRNFRETAESMVKKLAHTDYGKLIKACLHTVADGDFISCLERRGEAYLLGKLKAASLISFGPEPLFAYLLFKETEIRNLRMILFGLQVGFSQEEIMERLRMPDV